MSVKKEELLRIVKFTLFSLSAGIIQTVTFTLLNEILHLQYWPCYLTALVLSVVWNFTLNRKFTFHSAANIPVAMLKVAAYYLVFTPVSTYGGQLLNNLGVNEYIVLLLSMLLNLVTEFLYSKYVVFKDSK